MADSLLNSPPRSLGQALHERRLELGWSLREAAKRSGVSNGYISLIEHGEVQTPSPRYLLALSQCYGLPFDRLMALAGHPLEPPAPHAAALQGMPFPEGLDTAAPPGTRAPRLAYGVGTRGPGLGPSAVPSSPPPPATLVGEPAEPVDTARESGPDVFYSPEPSRAPPQVAEPGGVSMPNRTSPAGRVKREQERRISEHALLLDAVAGDMAHLPVEDLSQVRAFIAGLRAARSVRPPYSR